MVHDRDGTHQFLLNFPIHLLLTSILYALRECLVRIVLDFRIVDLRDLRSRIINFKREHAALIILFSGGVALFFRDFIDNLVQLVRLFFIMVILLDQNLVLLLLVSFGALALNCAKIGLCIDFDHCVVLLLLFRLYDLPEAQDVLNIILIVRIAERNSLVLRWLNSISLLDRLLVSLR